MTGRFYDYFRTGRSSGSLTETVLESLLAQQGTAFDDGDGSLVWAETQAHAKAIAALLSAMRRLRNQFDPVRMHEFVPRWETIFGIRPPPTASMDDRRAEIARRWSFLARRPSPSNTQRVLNDVAPELSPTVVSTSSALANTHTPTAVAVPGGITTTGDGLWLSSIAQVAIETTKPATMSEAAFDKLSGRILKQLDDFLPAWCTFDWYRDGEDGTGFELDDDFNLDVEGFDS